MKTVGVIGGMGPAATIDFCARVVKATPAKRDQDHLHLIVDSNPAVPDRNAAIAGTGPSSGPAMAAMAVALEAAGADFLVIACNTAHAFIDDVRRATGLPLIDMIEETASEIARRHPAAQSVGLLAVDGCLQAQLYQRALARRGLRAVTLDAADQRTFMELIYAIKAGTEPRSLAPMLLGLIEALASAGADIIAAACTEVPMVVDGQSIAIPIVSSTDVLVARTIAFARDERSPAAIDPGTVV